MLFVAQVVVRDGL